MEEIEETRFPDLTWAELPAAIERRKEKREKVFGDDPESYPFPGGLIGFDYLRNFALRLQNEADVLNTIPAVHHLQFDLIVIQDATGKNIVTVSPLRENAYRVSTRLVRRGQPDGGEKYEPLDLESAVRVVKQVVHALRNI